MGPLSIYLICLVSVLGAFILYSIWRLIDSTTRRFIFSFLRKNLLYTMVVRRRTGSSDMTVYGLLSIVLLIASNITACSLWIADRADLAKRCGTLFMINVVPLYLGGRTNFFVDRVLQLPLDQYSFLHRWMGRICVIQGLVHGIMNAATSSSSITENLLTTLQLLSVIAAIGALSFLYIRRYMYELFLKTHLIFALTLIGILWFHVKFTTTRMLVNSGSGLSKKMVFNHFSDGHASSQAMELIIDLAKPWNVGPGQYIYLTLPNVGRHKGGFIQSHPYNIAWVDGPKVTVLIQRYKGFSDTLFTSPDPESSVIVDGPYGHPQSLDRFDKVLLMASGIGIASHLLTIKQLLLAHESQTARVRRLTLVWFLEAIDQEAWAHDYLRSLCNMDHRKVFTLVLFVPPTLDASKTGPREQVIERWRRTEHPLDVAWYINEESSAEAGNMAVSVCGTSHFEAAVRRGVRSSKDDIYMLIAGFRPEETALSRSSRTRYS
ncbi:hypothetical protein K458DRAFT_445146 [Lentithecium fluviatile CBS 122367]|uniref:ferric-chelate reductase (NADPH) n=1 Tax=Lentithecium fluviatile CBS 122367 TaxID=1168545 RepID=A0A6G1IR07_9PLEO|nr:hypothetical protein K458DRAFT_445146 [Lentithecium fluviatile CBS 122367]